MHLCELMTYPVKALAPGLLRAERHRFKPLLDNFYHYTLYKPGLLYYSIKKFLAQVNCLCTQVKFKKSIIRENSVNKTNSLETAII